MRAKPDWTLTDHADWLDERHHDRRLDTGVELALDLSYQHLPGDRRRLLRLLALHPGQDFDAYAATALADTDLDTTQTHLDHLCGDHLLQQGSPGRYTFHDLVRAHATTRAHDEDRPPDRRAALSRLFDHYLSTTATAMNTLHPAEAHLRPQLPPSGTPAPDLTDPATALTWLEVERPTLVAVVAHTATHGWPTHTTRLSRALFRYFTGGHNTDALTVHGHARDAARHSGDPTGQAHALTDLGTTHWGLGRYEPAAEHFQQALDLFRRVGDPAGEARALGNLGVAEERLGRYRPAADHYAQVLTLCRETGDGDVEAHALNGLGEVEVRSGRYGQAGDHFQQALTLYRQSGNHTGEASTLDSLGTLHIHLGQPAQATGHYQQALTIARETSNRGREACALNGLGEAADAAGRPTDALTHHTAAHTIAADTGDRDQQARAHHALGTPTQARHHYQHALNLYTDLGVPEADQIRAHLAALDNTNPTQR
jgi:tetratricopeptide (TPR) repeat protein